MHYNLFLDDIRTIDMVYKNTDRKFSIVRNYEDFVSHIKEFGLPDLISFDNDLGSDEKGNVLPDGYTCVKWLVYDSGLDLSNLKFNIHSSNPIARLQIESLLNNYKKYVLNETS